MCIGITSISPKNPNNSKNVAESTVDSQEQAVGSDDSEMIKLTAEACIRNDKMLEDSLGWLTDTKEVTSAMDYFYDKTGIQPYLLICDRIDGKGGEITDAEAEAYLDVLYSSLYADEGHMIFVFMEYEESEYITFLYTGSDADSLMDGEAKEIFLTHADRYYTDSSLSDEAYFAKIFRNSADDIMGK